MAAYEETGRAKQKARTRSALIEATRALLASGADPTVEDAAAAAEVSRTTAYRYFPNQSALLQATFPEIDRESLLGDDPPADVRQRVERTVDEQLRIVREWEPQLRAAWRVSLLPGSPAPALRGGRAVRWFEDALAPLAATHPVIDRRHLAISLRAVAGIECYAWLVDVAGLRPKAALQVMRSNALAVLAAALSAPRSAR